MATATQDKPVRLGDLPVVKTNILENARQYDKGVVGGYSGTFPLTAASKGGIYLLPSTGKFYVCETAYNGAQISAPNSNFVELSVWKNHDRLTNLFEVATLENSVETNIWKPVPFQVVLTEIIVIFSSILLETVLIRLLYLKLAQTKLGLLHLSLTVINLI